MGFRDYSPGLNRFLTRDTFNGALTDLHLGADPWNLNRYTFGGGNPISRVELHGHLVAAVQGTVSNWVPSFEDGQVVSAANTVTGDSIVNDSINQQVTLNGVIVSDNFVTDPYQLAKEVSTELDTITGGRSEPSSTIAAATMSPIFQGHRLTLRSALKVTLILRRRDQSLFTGVNSPASTHPTPATPTNSPTTPTATAANAGTRPRKPTTWGSATTAPG